MSGLVERWGKAALLATVLRATMRIDPLVAFRSMIDGWVQSPIVHCVH